MLGEKNQHEKPKRLGVARESRETPAHLPNGPPPRSVLEAMLWDTHIFRSVFISRNVNLVSSLNHQIVLIPPL